MTHRTFWAVLLLSTAMQLTGDQDTIGELEFTSVPHDTGCCALPLHSARNEEASINKRILTILCTEEVEDGCDWMRLYRLKFNHHHAFNLLLTYLRLFDVIKSHCTRQPKSIATSGTGLLKFIVG